MSNSAIVLHSVSPALQLEMVPSGPRLPMPGGEAAICKRFCKIGDLLYVCSVSLPFWLAIVHVSLCLADVLMSCMSAEPPMLQLLICCLHLCSRCIEFVEDRCQRCDNREHVTGMQLIMSLENKCISYHIHMLVSGKQCHKRVRFLLWLLHSVQNNPSWSCVQRIATVAAGPRGRLLHVRHETVLRGGGGMHGPAQLGLFSCQHKMSSFSCCLAMTELLEHAQYCMIWHDKHVFLAHEIKPDKVTVG